MADGGGVPVQNLGLQELNTVKEQLEQEVKQLNASLNQLTLAGNKFRFTEEAVQSVSPENAGKSIMVPLSSSLYIHGEVNDISKVLVDVGTGYFIGAHPLLTPSSSALPTLLLLFPCVSASLSLWPFPPPTPRPGPPIYLMMRAAQATLSRY